MGIGQPAMDGLYNSIKTNEGRRAYKISAYTVLAGVVSLEAWAISSIS